VESDAASAQISYSFSGRRQTDLPKCGCHFFSRHGIHLELETRGRAGGLLRRPPSRRIARAWSFGGQPGPQWERTAIAGTMVTHGRHYTIGLPS
jgi:hypothetical protein